MESNTVHCRLASEKDLELLVPLFSAYRKFYRKEAACGVVRDFLQERLQKKDSLLFLVEPGVAFAQVYFTFSSVHMRREWILNDLYVDSAWRRQGLASLLLQQVEKEARKAGVSRLHLKTEKENTSAQRLYLKEGWKEETLFTSFIRECGLTHKV